MARWHRGDPYPEDWPSWLREADIDWCNVEVSPDGVVVWRNGVWLNGFWYNGVWEDGLWEQGTWRFGTWVSGTWNNGIWRDGIWNKGVWRDGTWHYGFWENGSWRSGTWEDGTWHGGHWESGTWCAGLWKGGVWHEGEWKGGVQQCPKFGWHIVAGELISGWLDKRLHITGPEEWGPLLKDMDPQKALEYEILLLWDERSKDLRRKPKASGPSLWDHIIEEES